MEILRGIVSKISQINRTWEGSSRVHGLRVILELEQRTYAKFVDRDRKSLLLSRKFSTK